MLGTDRWDWQIAELIFAPTYSENIAMNPPLNLQPHSRCSAVTKIEAAIALSRADRLILSYIVTGNMNNVRMPPDTATARGEELWRHTCYEAFLRASSRSTYYELNFAPTTQWAAYRFDDYRTGMTLPEISTPSIEVHSSPDHYCLRATLELDQLSSLPRGDLWHVGLSALIEDMDGNLSYWALSHPPGKPDFHHHVCFAHEFSLVAQP